MTKDKTFAAPLFVKVRFIVKETGEVREQDVFMGDFPLMTHSGTFHHQRDRAGRRDAARAFARGVRHGAQGPDQAGPDGQPHAEPGVLARVRGRDQGLRLGAHRPQEEAARHACSSRRSGMGGPEEILSRFNDSWLIRNTLERDDIASQEEALLEVFRRQRPGEPVNRENAENLVQSLFFDPKRYDLSEVGRYKVNKKLKLDVPLEDHTLTIEDITGLLGAPHPDLRGGRRGGGVRPDQLRAHPPQARRVRALRQQASEDRGGVGAGGVPDRDVPHGARRPRADDDPGRGVHNAADGRQHQAGGERHKGVLRLLASSRSSWTRRTRSRASRTGAA